MKPLAVTLALALAACSPAAEKAAEPKAEAPLPKSRPSAEVLAESPASDWRIIDPARTLYMDLPKGRVIIELAPDFAPEHVANIKTLAQQTYFDSLAIVRVQDNFVTQWGDPAEESPKSLGSAKAKVIPEVTRPIEGLAFDELPERDVYAPSVGFSGGMPAARDPATGQAWLAHCYGMVAVGRENDPMSGNGSALYAVIGHSPRHLDRNLAVVGRVVEGMELLSGLPRGTGPLGFYETTQEFTPIRRVRLASDLPANEQVPLQALRTDSATFKTIVEGRRNRIDDFYQTPAGRIELCNVMLPVRRPPPAAPPS